MNLPASPFTPVDTATSSYTHHPWEAENIRELLEGDRRPPFTDMEPGEVEAKLSYRGFPDLIYQALEMLRDTTDKVYVTVLGKGQHNARVDAAAYFAIEQGLKYFYLVGGAVQGIIANKTRFNVECRHGGCIKAGSIRAQHYRQHMKTKAFKVSLGSTPGERRNLHVSPSLKNSISHIAEGLELDMGPLSILVIIRGLAFQPHGVLQDNIREQLQGVWDAFEECMEITHIDTGDALRACGVDAGAGAGDGGADVRNRKCTCRG